MAKRTRKTKRARGLALKTTLVEVDDALERIVLKKRLSWTEISQQIWFYIKHHYLQDPRNGRIIYPDYKLSRVIGSSPITCWQMSKKLKEHVTNLPKEGVDNNQD